MKKVKILLYCLFILETCSLWAQSAKKGECVFKSEFNTEKGRIRWSKLATAQWCEQGSANNTRLLINGTGMIKTTIDLASYRGMKLLFKCQVKAENVTKPTAPYLGVKFMLHYKSNTGELWKNENNVYGTFDWKELSFSAVIPNDVSEGDLSLGLQDCSGKVWFDSLSVTVLNVPMPPVKQRHKNHVYTQFRGVMSPPFFIESDIKTLSSKWKANLIRWQLNMTYAQSLVIGTDLDKYTKWINEKLQELDSVLVSCHKYGIKVVIDLHSPLGGSKDGVTQLFYNKEYNDYFVNLWKKIAKRYKGNTSVWGYDLINEPIQNNSPLQGMDYCQTQIKAAEAIRSIDRKIPIIFEVEEGDDPTGFISLSPIPVTNVIYEVHMYAPHNFTHQGVHNNAFGITYPGTINGIYYDKNALKGILQPVRDFQLKYNVPIYVGEFSAIRWAPGAAQYINDCVSIFEEYRWNWTYHAFRESNGWDVEYENGASKADPPIKAMQNTDRKDVLLKWFAKNKKKE